MGHLTRRVGQALVVAAASVFATACVDKEKCDEAIRVTREALTKEQPDIARQWRDRAWRICNDSTLTSGLDKELTDKEAELAKRVADNAKQIADGAQQRLNQATSLWKAVSGIPEVLSQRSGGSPPAAGVSRTG